MKEIDNKTLTEVLKKVRKVEVKAKGLSDHIFAGEYHTSFKGRGMSFSEVREYQYGDEVRNIDWNVTARYNSPFVKVFEEERELNIMLLIDVSHSEVFGSKYLSKREMITDIAAVLSFSALRNNDKIGVIFFSDRVEKYIPASKGKRHVLRIIRECITTEASDQHKSDIKPALQRLQAVQKKKSIVFLLSDFLLADYKECLSPMTRKHDFIGIQVWDPSDAQLPNVGLVKVKDAESNQNFWIDSSDASSMKSYSQYFEAKKNETKKVFSSLGLDLIQAATDGDFVPQLQSFFKRRMTK